MQATTETQTRRKPRVKQTTEQKREKKRLSMAKWRAKNNPQKDHSEPLMPWLECAICYHKLGFGSRTVMRVFCISGNHTRVDDAMRRRGVKRFDGFGRLAAANNCRRGEIKKRPWWGDHASGWMDEYRPKFFDWSIIWKSEASKRSSKAYFHSLTPDEKLARGRAQTAKNPNKRAEYTRRWKANNPERAKELQRRSNERLAIKRGKPIPRSRDLILESERIAAKIQSMAARSLRRMLLDFIHTKGNNHNSLIGCNKGQLCDHLESMFKPGMKWENRGWSGWHIDHIKPLASFNLNDPQQVAVATHYTNLQPLWNEENNRKGAAHDESFYPLVLTNEPIKPSKKKRIKSPNPLIMSGIG